MDDNKRDGTNMDQLPPSLEFGRVVLEMLGKKGTSDDRRS